MRVTVKTNPGFEAKAISGTHTVLIALNCPDQRRKGLMGFAMQCTGPGGSAPQWLRSQKVFKSVVPDPKSAHDPKDPRKNTIFPTDKFPVQSFLWGNYFAQP